MKIKKVVLIIFLIIILVCIDQLIKINVTDSYKQSIPLINNIVNITYIENTGVAYGIRR